MLFNLEVAYYYIMKPFDNAYDHQSDQTCLRNLQAMSRIRDDQEKWKITCDNKTEYMEKITSRCEPILSK